jgi:hypothetical protein
VVGDELAVGGGDGGERGLHLGVEGPELVEVGAGPVAEGLVVEAGHVVGEGVGERLGGRRHPGGVGEEVRVDALAVVGVLVAALAALAALVRGLVGGGQGVDVVDGGEHGGPVVDGPVDRILQAGLEACAVDHDEVGFAQGGGLPGRGLEVVGVGVRGHDHLDLGGVADQVLDDVAEDGGGHHDVRPAAVAAGRAVASAARRGQQGAGQGDGDDGEGVAAHLGPRTMERSKRESLSATVRYGSESHSHVQLDSSDAPDPAPLLHATR